MLMQTDYWKYADDLPLLKTTLVLFKGIYRMICIRFLTGHLPMVSILMLRNARPLRLISAEPHHIMLTCKLDLTGLSMLIKPKSWDSRSKTTWNGRPRLTFMLNMLKKANQRLFMLRSLKRLGFFQDELTVVFNSYFRLVIEYLVWHSGLTL